VAMTSSWSINVQNQTTLPMVFNLRLPFKNHKGIKDTRSPSYTAVSLIYAFLLEKATIFSLAFRFHRKPFFTPHHSVITRSLPFSLFIFFFFNVMGFLVGNLNSSCLQLTSRRSWRARPVLAYTQTPPSASGFFLRIQKMKLCERFQIVPSVLSIGLV
jgi:hypothetical protein